MHRRSLLIGLWLASMAPAIAAEFSLRDFHPHLDGLADDLPALRQCFAAAAAAGGGTVVIPAGDYGIGIGEPVTLSSSMRVIATGARFHLPPVLPDKARMVIFTGADCHDLNWEGGHFIGHCFDWRRSDAAWPPNANTRMIVVTTSPGGTTGNLAFHGLSSEGIAGAVITVLGAGTEGSDSAVQTYATDISLSDCVFERSGKFMWDYGLLWQITVWPEDYDEREHALAASYFRNDLVRAVRLDDGDEQVQLSTGGPPPPISSSGLASQAVCFFGDSLPKNVIRGRQYFVVESALGHLRIAEQPGGAALRFAGAAGPQARMITDLQAAYYALYAPTGSGPGKGAIDIVGCRTVQVSHCRLSALGDTMHIQKSDGIVFAGNHITGSRMGAFFLAEHCRNATITGNLIEGTNGSRVMSIEKSCANVTISGNIFQGGGRGSWINQPQSLVLQGNIFVNNTTKGEADPHRGRRTFQTGGWERYPELYFTTYEPGGRYGPVIVSNNTFTTGPEALAAIRFAAGAHDVLVSGNVISGAITTVLIEGDAEVKTVDVPAAEIQQVPLPLPSRLPGYPSR
jgi:hypothetical protein